MLGLLVLAWHQSFSYSFSTTFGQVSSIFVFIDFLKGKKSNPYNQNDKIYAWFYVFLK